MWPRRLRSSILPWRTTYIRPPLTASPRRPRQPNPLDPASARRVLSYGHHRRTVARSERNQRFQRTRPMVRHRGGCGRWFDARPPGTSGRMARWTRARPSQPRGKVRLQTAGSQHRMAARTCCQAAQVPRCDRCGSCSPDQGYLSPSSTAAISNGSKAPLDKPLGQPESKPSSMPRDGRPIVTTPPVGAQTTGLRC